MQAQAQQQDYAALHQGLKKPDKRRYERRIDSRYGREEQPVRRFTPGQIPTLTRDPILEVFSRVIDLSGASVGILLSIPLLMLSMLLIKITSHGPVFFCQIRVGKGGKLFRMYKLRTMVVNAEQQRDQLKFKNEMSGPVFKIAKDPRMTWIGRYLRKLSIDEIPQFWNILLGDMSLVGPRPPLASEVKKYKHWQLQRLSVKPGLTCLWQISGRNRIGFEEWVRLDIRYIRQRSLWMDCKIMFQTLKVIFIRPDGT